MLPPAVDDALLLDPPWPPAAAAIPPAAAAPTSAKTKIVRDDFDFATGSAFVCVTTALAASPFHDAVTRIRYCPAS